MSIDFSKRKHPHVAAMEAKWALTHAMYTAEGIEGYLVQHPQAESEKQFRARQQLLDFHPFTADTIRALIGSLFQKENEVHRTFGRLGSHETPGTIAHRLWRSVDQDGSNYSTMLRRAAETLLEYNELWCVVTKPGQEARVRILPPTMVPDFTPEGVIVKSVEDKPRSILEEPGTQEVYTVYTLEGWQRYVMSDGRAVLQDEAPYNEGGRVFVDRSGGPALPIFRLTAPFSFYFAWQLAKSHRAMMNAESDRDALLRDANHPLLSLAVGDDEQFLNRLKESLREGARALPKHRELGDHEWLSPDTACIEAANATLEQKQKTFRETALQLFSSEGVVRTATEVAAQKSTGLASALALLAARMEDFEMQVLHLLEQCYFDGGYASNCSWPTDYSGVSLESSEAGAREGAQGRSCRNCR